ncbi:argininosuccinate lyase [Propionigenium maris DSM 9537]|uniref:Argininosuccinate lyase n=1 Tax=Propionigenium maris DSM 9537 TaxID=1123000 RepID=A0A9W6GLY8_9FUSO|nr:argininosuccinate lyase [Propionigenium maris]GLI56246.1 argininosuccinate lyase [Propionigenium maris DSM 9537]
MKLWGGRFVEGSSKILEEFNASINFDKRMYAEDIEGSIAHSKMLAKQGIISSEEQRAMKDGLLEIKEEIEAENFVFHIEDEDIHMAIEKRLIEKIGQIGGKLHTARSRNDQVAVDIRMYLKKEGTLIKKLLEELMGSILNKSIENKEVIMPGYTHLQRAQPISAAHHFMAYFQMFKRDYERLEQSIERMDELPLGAGALAGTTYNIDREFVAKELGFEKVTENSIDTVSDRDFIIEMNFVISMISMHLSRFCEEIVVWSTTEFSFVEMADTYSTGSSIMPQKKNPDVAELIRGKTGRIYGNLVGIMTVMKGLPLAYNKDTQEDKEGIFDSIDTIKISLVIFKEMFETMKINADRMYENLEGGFINATDVADYLAKKGVPFREAHRIVGEIVVYCEVNKRKISELKLGEFKEFDEAFGEDIHKKISLESCVWERNSYGGTGRKALEVQMNNGKKYLEKIGG